MQHENHPPTLLYAFAAWSVISILAGMALSRILQRLGCSETSERIVPVSEWPDESVTALLAATEDPEFVMAVFDDIAFLEQIWCPACGAWVELSYRYSYEPTVEHVMGSCEHCDTQLLMRREEEER